MKLQKMAFAATAVLFLGAVLCQAATYEIGPGKTYTTISSFPWEDLAAGDTVKIYYKSTPYYEKFGIFSVGTSSNPITVQGVPGTGGELPIISGDGAVSRSSTYLDYWSEDRQVIKVGGSNTPDCYDEHNEPEYIIIEDLEVRSGRSAYSFTDGDGNPQTYTSNASSIRLECGEQRVVDTSGMRRVRDGAQLHPA
ncbi:MAG: hypothetical protein ACYTAN_17335 [Planctomycetota bacterium]|jgi:hypothetical protein